MTTVRQISVYEHPTFVPNVIARAPALRFPNGDPAPSLGELLFLPLDNLRRIPVGYLNLACAALLPDTADLDIPACMRTLYEWADFVRSETDRQLYRFHRAPDEYNNSEAYFRVLVLITALQRDLGVRYDPDCAKTREFKSSREGFIHGLLTGDRVGTCANMPVLYIAIGRLLGYPIYLVRARGHLLCRWHSIRTAERFNIEASGLGLNVFPDEYYYSWPAPITPEEAHHGVYMRNLDPAEELGCFMATRGHCLEDKGHLLDAIVAYSHAHRLAPTDPCCMASLLKAINKELDLRADGTLPCTYRQAENFKPEIYTQPGRFFIDDRFSARSAGVNLDETSRGRVAQ